MNETRQSPLDKHPPSEGLEPQSDPGKQPWIRCLMQVLWPAFGGAALTVGLVFSMIDPLQIEWVHVHLNDSRQAAYTLGFLMFWALYTMACSLTWYLASTETPGGIVRLQNRKPL